MIANNVQLKIDICNGSTPPAPLHLRIINESHPNHTWHLRKLNLCLICTCTLYCILIALWQITKPAKMHAHYTILTWARVIPVTGANCVLVAFCFGVSPRAAALCEFRVSALLVIFMLTNHISESHFPHTHGHGTPARGMVTHSVSQSPESVWGSIFKRHCLA